MDVFEFKEVKKRKDDKKKKFIEAEVFDLKFKPGKKVAMGKKEDTSSKEKVLNSLDHIGRQKKSSYHTYLPF